MGIKMVEGNYTPKDIEEKWYKVWEDNKYFAATTDENKANFSIMVPPPNVTGILHMGHILNNTIQDTLIRHKRMRGFNALWMPGMDHAGIATQNKVERLLAEDSLTKEDIGREEFIKKTWEWKEKHGGIITQQQRKLGNSFDWDRERFTMDEGLSKAVNKIFKDLYNDGLIYRGEYMVNWCPRCITALSDDEVEHEEKQGKIWHISYPIKDSDEKFIVATTRPETMLGDSGVAVNPSDERYAHLIGKKVILPITGREVPIITDEYVDVEFGAGVVKMTPAHDPNDFEIGKKNNLEIIKVLSDTGVILAGYGEFSGLDRFEARKKLVKALDEQGFLVKVEEHKNNVGHCYRCDTVIEPNVSNQWFVKTDTLAKRALDVVKEKEITIRPKRWEKVYYNWMENIRDWCISRQIWWGHRIPAYYGPDDYIFIAEDLAEAKEQAKKHYGEEVELRQENDVLDTWFSSALWPFSTLGWPEKTKELELFYPTSTLVTGADIIFFWVARMVMFGLYEIDEIPFKDVYLHGIVRDEKGRKMSKSLGNSPDPLKLIDKYGSDAIRFTMLYNTSQGQDVHFSEKLIEMGGNFANKIWNASKFVVMNLEGFSPEGKELADYKLELVDKWIVSKLNKTADYINEKLDIYNLDEAAKAVYEFFKGDFCDWYVELAKVRIYNESNETSKKTAQMVMWYVLEQSLRLLHPFMPFITEEIWQSIKASGETIMLMDFPLKNEAYIDDKSEGDFEYLKALISSVRNIRAEVGVSPAKEVDVFIKSGSSEELATIKENQTFLIKIANIAELQWGEALDKPENASLRVAGNSELYIPLAGLINKEVEIKKIKEKIEKTKKELARVAGKLSNEKFTAKAPKNIIEREERIRDEYKYTLEKLEENLAAWEK